MKKLFCTLVMVIIVLIGNLPAYATVTDVNIVPPPPPSAPIDVTMSAVTDTTAQVSWPAVTSALQYTVHLNGKVYSGSNSPQVTLTGLEPHTNYTLYVIANNTGGDSLQSPTVTFTTLSPTPIANADPTVTTTGTIAKLLWQPLPTNYNISQYTVYLDGQVSTTVTPQTGMQTATINDLATGNHTVTISATNDNREGPQSQPTSFMVSTVPAPLGVQFYNKSSDTVWLTWQTVPGAVSYNLLLNNLQVGQTYQPSYIVKGLTPDKDYQISVVTVMPDGNKSQGTNISVQTEPLTPTISVQGIETKIFNYMPDLTMYIEIAFALMSAILLSKTLKLTLKRR